MKNFHKTIRIVLGLVLIGLIVWGMIYFSKQGFDLELIKTSIQGQGIKGQIIYLGYTILSVILSPLNSIILWPVALLVYGYWLAAFLTFLGSFLGGLVNFLLARKFGRPLVAKIIGPKGMKEVDQFTDIKDWKMLFLLRFLGNISFDYVSYAIGLTKIKAQAYLIITAITIFLWTFLGFFILEKALNMKKIFAILVIATFYAIVIYGGIKVWKRIKKQNKKKE